MFHIDHGGDFVNAALPESTHSGALDFDTLAQPAGAYAPESGFSSDVHINGRLSGRPQGPVFGHTAPPPAGPEHKNGVNERQGGESVEAKLARFRIELDAWTKAAKTCREQAATGRTALRGFHRLRAYRMAEVEGLARYYRTHPRADVAPGLFSLVVAMSDNDEYGACHLSVPRMAEVLSRTVESIRDALHRLVEVGIIGMQERRATSTLYWPLLPKLFTEENTSLHWLVEFYSPRRDVGRPTKNPLPLEGEPISRNPLPLDPQGVSETPSPSSRKPPPPPPRDDSTNESQREESKIPLLRAELPLAAADPAKPYLQQLEELFAQAKSKLDINRIWSMEEREIGALPMKQRHEAALLRKKHEDRIKPPKQPKPRTQIKPDWRPSQDDVTWVLESYSATPAQIAQQGEKFRDYHRSRNNTMADWSAAWRTWWGNGFHKIPRRLSAPAPLLDVNVGRTEGQRILDEELAAIDGVLR